MFSQKFLNFIKCFIKIFENFLKFFKTILNFLKNLLILFKIINNFWFFKIVYANLYIQFSKVYVE